MWLLNARTRKLKSFHSSPIPKYAILSHRWEDEEVTFDDMKNHPERLKGYQKLVKCCNQALTGGATFDADGDVTKIEPIEWVWIDTCCIDKASSTELSEAINSMYKWYAGAEICYAYLFDVVEAHSFEKSSWFTRGWTLQELLAPKQLFFFDRDWSRMGYRSRCSSECLHNTCEQCTRLCVLETVSKITKMPTEALQNFRPEAYSIAQRMSWAAERTTTREEDIAYCLLGVFGIHMPLIYGEGEDAYRRLQEEIMKVSNDLSLFVWEGLSCQNFGMLARHPSCFKIELEQPAVHVFDPQFAKRSLSKGFKTDNGGITLNLGLQHYSGQIFMAYLDEPHIFARRHTANNSSFKRVMFLERDLSRTRYHRVKVHGSCHMVMKMNPHTTGVREVQITRDTITERYLDNTRISFPGLPRGWKLFTGDSGTAFGNLSWLELPAQASVGTSSCADREIMMKPLTSFGFVCCLSANTAIGSTLDIFIGFDVDFVPICLLQCNDDFWGDSRKRLFFTDQTTLLKHFTDLLPHYTQNQNCWNERQSLIAMRCPMGNVEIQSSQLHDDKVINKPFLTFEPCEGGYQVNLTSPPFTPSSKLNIKFGDFWAASSYTPVVRQPRKPLQYSLFRRSTNHIVRVARRFFDRANTTYQAVPMYFRLIIQSFLSLMTWRPQFAFLLMLFLLQIYTDQFSSVVFLFLLLFSVSFGPTHSFLLSRIGQRTTDWPNRFLEASER